MQRLVGWERAKTSRLGPAPPKEEKEEKGQKVWWKVRASVAAKRIKIIKKSWRVQSGVRRPVKVAVVAVAIVVGLEEHTGN
jgi:hypothetical protein